MRAVSIDASYFRKALLDYNDWRWAFIRELMQNGIDAGSKEIRFSATLNKNGDTVVECVNDAPSMTEDILLNKFMAIGGTTKGDGEGVGGFGIAKVVIALAHSQYRIETGEFKVEGSGGEYEFSKGHVAAGFTPGTRTTVVMPGDERAELETQAKIWASYAQWRGDLWFNDEHLETHLLKGSRRKEFSWGVVYTNKSDSYRVVVRIDGMPMFHQYASIDRCVVVELNGSSSECLTSNRDGLSGDLRGELSNFITELAVDKRSALKSNKPRYARFVGDRFSHIKVDAEVDGGDIVNVLDIVDIEPVESESESISQVENVSEATHVSDCHPSPCESSASELMDYEVEEEIEAPAQMLGHEFIVKNETDLVVPAYYRPDNSDFSSYSRKLTRIWGRLMIELHRMYDHEASFAIGFIFSDDTVAEHENGDYGRVYYLNPAKIVEQDASYSKSFKKRWKLTDRNQLLATACHEFLHGQGYSYHDETYAGKLTKMMGEIMDERKRFNWCFK